MGCRKYKGRQYWDDLTGETHLPEELEEMAFAFDGQALVIDLSDENATAFREAMAPFVRAARPASKSKVLATLPKRERHLKAVPDVPVSPPAESASEPESEPQNAPISEKGQSVEPRTEPEGTRVPDEPSDASNLGFGPQVREANEARQAPERTPEEWAPHAPASNDDQPARVAKTRAWATLMGTPPEQPLTKMMFRAWEEFYRRQGWRNLG